VSNLDAVFDSTGSGFWQSRDLRDPRTPTYQVLANFDNLRLGYWRLNNFFRPFYVQLYSSSDNVFRNQFCPGHFWELSGPILTKFGEIIGPNLFYMSDMLFRFWNQILHFFWSPVKITEAMGEICLSLYKNIIIMDNKTRPVASISKSERFKGNWGRISETN